MERQLAGSLSEILNKIWVAHGDRPAAAGTAARDLSSSALAELFAIVATAHAGTWLTAEAEDDHVLLMVGEFRDRATASSAAGGRTLIELPDIKVRFSTTSDLIATAWGAPLVAPAASLLLALQYARHRADSLVYRSADRNLEFAEVSQWLGIDPDLLRALVICTPRMLSAATA